MADICESSFQSIEGFVFMVKEELSEIFEDALEEWFLSASILISQYGGDSDDLERREKLFRQRFIDVLNRKGSSSLLSGGIKRFRLIPVRLLMFKAVKTFNFDTFTAIRHLSDVQVMVSERRSRYFVRGAKIKMISSKLFFA